MRWRMAKIIVATAVVRPFADAVTGGYETDLQTFWSRFAQTELAPR